ncbi:MAG: PQQ-dependent sugar dehydrogenase [Verrucomicrobiota bacterium]|nr:PQQ-dependent sugar dehydrogenase [Verrucomicrobiota bacterium]
MNFKSTGRILRTSAGPRVALAIGALLTLGGCFVLRPSSGGGQTSFKPPRKVSTRDIALPPAYRIEPIATGLTFPTGIAFDDAGTPHVVESGYSYGEVWTTPRLLRIEPGGRARVVAEGRSNGPWNGVAWSRGSFYVAEGGVREGGRILKITPAGKMSTLMSGLPSMGDHHTNGPAVGPDGWIYFGQGTATNSALVGEDNAQFGWLARHPNFHDIPGQDITLTGLNFVTRSKGRRVETGAFLPYGTPSRPGQVIRGRVPCSGAVMRLPPGGGRPQLVAWGFRNPFGLAFSPGGELYVTDNGYDDRGSRPVFGSGDLLWKVRRGAWHGWPDFSGNLPLAQNHFSPPGEARPEFLLARRPNPPPKPAAVLGVHSSANGFDFSRSEQFGHRGEAFVALFGDQAPVTGKVVNAVGFKVVRVNVRTGEIEDFAVNKGRINAPASARRAGGLERPVAVRFDRSGRSLYVVDFGVLTMSSKGARPYQNTGVLWRITRL